MRKKRNIKTNNNKTIVNINDINEDTIVNVKEYNNNVDIQLSNVNNINTLIDSDNKQKKLNNKKSHLTQTQIKQKQRKQQWDDIPHKTKDNLILYILENFPSLNMQPNRIIQYMRLLYTSNQYTLNALDKLQTNNTLSAKDIIPIDDSVNINVVYYPKQIDTIEIDQILSDKQTAFLNNIRNNMDKKTAFFEAGYSEHKLHILNVITQTNIDKFDNDTYKHLKKVWFEYWKIKKQQSEATGITEDYILSGLKKTVDFSVKSLVDDNGNFKNINDLDDETAKQITEIKISEAKTTCNKTKQTTTRTTTISLKVGDKNNARKELSKLQAGIFAHVRDKTINHNHNVSGGIMHGSLDVNKLSQQQLDSILMIDQQNNTNELNMNEYDNDDVIQGEIVDDDN